MRRATARSVAWETIANSQNFNCQLPHDYPIAIAVHPQHGIAGPLLLARFRPWNFGPRRRGTTSSSRLESTVDTGIKPGDDFFGYANGAWLKAAVLPAGKNRWAVRDDINEQTRRQVEGDP
jgi:hypothetical protein